jgi:TolA-binding protein
MFGVRDERNDRYVLVEYERAEHFGAEFEPGDEEALIETHLAIGDLDAALARAEALPAELADRRVAYQKQIAIQSLSRPVPETERAMAIVAALLADPELAEDDRVWAVGEQARLSLEEGRPEDAIEQILRATPRLAHPSGDALAGLLTQLARAYMALEEPEMDEAHAQLARAMELFTPSNPASGEALLTMARIELQRGELDTARERLQRIGQWFGSTEWYLPSLLGLAEVEAAAGNHDAAIEHYQHLVAMAASDELPRWVTREGIAWSLTFQSAARLSAGDGERAQRLALMGLEVTGLEHAPASVLEAIAETDLAEAARLMPVERGTSEAVFALSEMDPATRAQVRRHLIRAAAYLRQYAERMVLLDREEYGRALWRSADAFDRAGDTDEAIRAFREYAESFPDEPLRAEARYRLAQAHQARGEFDEAAGLYRELVDERGVAGARDAGEFADRSVVALARTLLGDNEPANDREAEGLLLGALSGREVGSPESPHFREALLELGLMYYRAGRYPEAITRLEEAIERYPDEPRLAQVRYRLADSMRLSAREAGVLMQTELTPTRRREVEALRAERLSGAMEMFRAVRDELEALPARRRTVLDEEYLRNSYYFLGACAFEMGDYRAAIGAYDAARERYPSDPASLVAMVQIVNAYVELGEFDRARTANERARLFYQSLPEEVWDDPYLPMGRAEWQRWLDSMGALYAEGGA